MKKLFVLMIAAGMMLAISGTAMAGDSVVTSISSKSISDDPGSSKKLGASISLPIFSTRATTLLFPYATPLDDATWWFGMSFCNPSEKAGTARITVFEDDGDQGTCITGSLAAGRMVTMTGTGLLSVLTQTAGRGSLGDARCHIVVSCNFDLACGFGMMGNGVDSTGYSANGMSAEIDDDVWTY